MKRKVLHAKIHRAVVTQADLNYVGSITIDANLLDATGIVQNEVVMIADITNGARLETYVIRGEPGSGIIGMNGAAAHLVDVGDQIIIMAFGEADDAELEDVVAKVAVVDEENRIEQMFDYPCLPSLSITF